jgi:hypothetical protein
MSRRISAVAVVLLALFCVSPSPARAQDDGHAEHNKGGIGFHDTTAPLGVRWWLASQKVGIDLGFGFSSDDAAPDGYPDETLKSWAIGAGVPIVLRSWPRVHVLFRPGLLYSSQEVEDDTTPAVFDTESQKTLQIAAEIEGEAFILENFSVSASTGLAYESFDPGFGLEKVTSFSTIGNNFTNVGFHVYLFR